MNNLTKKLPVLCAMAVILSCIISVNALADQSGDYEYEVSNGKATITYYNGDGGDIIIPSKLGGYPVTAIGESAFCIIFEDDQRNGLKSVKMPSSVTSIGDEAFESCQFLSSINIPSGVTYIGESAFEGCYSLESITIPSNVTSIGKNAFFSCDSLVAINVASSNTRYTSQGGILFNKTKTKLICYPCSKAGSSYSIPSTVTNIEYGGISGCDNLTNITIPSSVTSIAGLAFCDCSNLSTAVFLGNAPVMDEYVFDFCGSGFTVYYIKGKSGFTNLWYGYPTKSFSLPTTPASLSAVSASYSSVKLTWKASTSAAGYEIYRATSSTGTYTRITTIANGSTVSYTNIGLTTGKTYYYKVRAYTKVGTAKVFGGYTAVKSAKPILSAPTGVKASRVSNSALKISWGKVAGVSGYEVYRATSSTGTYIKVVTIGNGSTVSYINSKLTDNKKYYYKVRAYRIVNGVNVFSNYSVVVSATP